MKVVLEETIFIYELSFKDSLIRINVYAFEDMMKSLPRQILLNYLLYFDAADIKRKKKEQIVTEEI